MKRTENKFTPLPDGTYTMYATEATIRHAKTGKIGVNLKLKVNEMDEAGNPQKNAGKSIFNTYYVHPDAESLCGMYCSFLDALGFKLDAEGDYVLEDGSKMPDVMAQKKGENGLEWVMAQGDVLPWLVGAPFICKTVHSINKYDKPDGTKSENDQYRLGFFYDNKLVRQSAHPRKTDVFVASPPQADAPVQPGSESNALPFGKNW